MVLLALYRIRGAAARPNPPKLQSASTSECRFGKLGALLELVTSRDVIDSLLSPNRVRE
jgi:hypothetical protein